MKMVMLAALLAVVGAVAAAYYFRRCALVTLRIASPGQQRKTSRVIQNPVAGLVPARGQIRLRPMQTDGGSASAHALAEGARPISPSSVAISRCLKRPGGATLRKNVAVLWVPPATKVKGQEGGPKIKILQLAGHRIGVVGRTEANVNLPSSRSCSNTAWTQIKVEIVQSPGP